MESMKNIIMKKIIGGIKIATLYNFLFKPVPFLLNFIYLLSICPIQRLI